MAAFDAIFIVIVKRERFPFARPREIDARLAVHIVQPIFSKFLPWRTAYQRFLFYPEYAYLLSVPKLHKK